MDPNSIFACFRPNVLKMEGYTPGEQWQDPQVIKLNTNENPYPPPVGVQKVLETYPLDRLRRYPDPLANRLRDYVAKLWGLPNREWVLVGNGSDDILTLLFRCFADETRKVVVLNPSYSLYPVLAQIQNAEVNEIILTHEFELPDEFPDEVWKANLWMITRPNAPTGNSFPKRRIE
ncbi:MAG: aminotransferase class I/II-fold pyridoxal phosphate-dependent enzyme, partial [Candidatus Bathyarchaeia archaeon]